jgi:hypothetical protein
VAARFDRILTLRDGHLVGDTASGAPHQEPAHA